MKSGNERTNTDKTESQMRVNKKDVVMGWIRAQPKDEQLE
jgi:hypothetical protein